MVKVICERPGITARQVATACNLDRNRCQETLNDCGIDLGLEMDQLTKRFYPAGSIGIKRNTKEGRSKVDQLSKQCLAALPRKLDKITDQQAAAKKREQAYIKEKAIKAEARKAAWEKGKALRAQRADALKHELDKQRHEIELQAEQQRFERRLEAEKHQKLDTIQSMDVNRLSQKITAPGFASEPEYVQLAATNQLLDQIEKENPKPIERKPSALKLAGLAGGVIGAALCVGFGFSVISSHFTDLSSDLKQRGIERQQMDLERRKKAASDLQEKQKREAAKELERQQRQAEREAEYQEIREKRQRAGNALRAAGYWIGPGGGCLTWNSKGNKNTLLAANVKASFELKG